MKNKNFFYLQYDKIKWENQEKTRINVLVNNLIIKNILKGNGQEIKIFDIGAGIGFFIKMLYKNLVKNYAKITIECCEPSNKNYAYFISKKPSILSTYYELSLKSMFSSRF